jgi:hypothetical protein
MRARHIWGIAGLCVILAGASRPAPRGEAGPDLAAALGSTVPNWPRHDIAVTLTVKNIGAGPCPRSVCQIFVRNAHAPRQTIKRIKKAVRALDAGDEFSFSFTIKLGLGLYEIEAVADRGNKIAEPDETNNTARLTLAGR